MFRLFHFSLWLNGFPMKKAQIAFEKKRQIPESEYEDYISQQKQEIVAYHLKNNSFYKKFVGDKHPILWEDIPIITKKELQIPLQERLSDGFSAKNTYLNKTSGSSGTPFVFAKDKYCHALTWQSYIFRFGEHGIDFNRSFQARFYGMPVTTGALLKERFKDFLAHRFRLDAFRLTDEKMNKNIRFFATKKIDYINGYTSSILLFAKFLSDKDIVLHQICPSLKVCIVTSEMLYPDDRLFLEKWLGVPVINEYGASEIDLIAFENNAKEWVINTETLFVEIVDENNRVLPYGEEGKIVITALYNKAHPFIRYEIGDLGIIDKKSTPKKTILKQLSGRKNDVVVLPSGNKAPGYAFYYMTKSVIEKNAVVKEIIVKQTAINQFVIEYVADKPLAEAQQKQIENNMHQYLEPNLFFSFEKKLFLNRKNRGKLRQFESLL